MLIRDAIAKGQRHDRAGNAVRNAEIIENKKRARRGRRMHRALDPDWQLGGGVLPINEGALGGGGALPSTK